MEGGGELGRMELRGETSQQRRLRTIGAHVSPISGGGDMGEGQQVQMQTTAGEYVVNTGYSVVLPEKLVTGQWNVHRHADSPLKLVEGWPGFPALRTLHDNFMYGLKNFPDVKMLGSRLRNPDGSAGEYKWMTYQEVEKTRAAIGSALVKHGIPTGARIGLYMINRPEWIIIDQTCAAYSYVSVPLYDTLGADAVQFITNHAELAAIFCSQDKLQTILSCLADLPTVKLIGVVEAETSPFPYQFLQQSGVEIISMSKLEAEGRENPIPVNPPTSKDVATICYTSGTTGTPKGVVIQHGAIIASAAGCTMDDDFGPGDVYISYLPLAHIYERVNLVSAVHNGVAIGFYQGDVLKLMDDCVALRPTMFASVPRLFNRIHDKIIANVRSSGGLKERLFNMAYNAKKEALAKGKPASGIWDRLVFNKLKAVLGGRVRIMLSGASPISAEVLDFMRICFGVQMTEGYGMTETSCAISRTASEDITSGHVGAPTKCCEVKLVDVPEMDYTSLDKPYPRGEICARGPLLFSGYFKDEVQTREILDEDGWLHTGDIGMWLPGGRLKIIDRKKNIFKLAQGEYIAPEKIENVYIKCSLICQCFVYGDSFNAALVMIAVADPDTLPEWAKANGIPNHNNLETLCKDPAVKVAVFQEMEAMAKACQLRGFECAKAVYVVAEQFSQENGMLTPTLKVKRPQAKAYYDQAIADMYDEIAKKEAEARVSKINSKSKAKL